MKEKETRIMGMDIIGDAPWGTHLCQFYRTKEDLIDILAPYFKAGLENNEFCMWVTSEPLNEKEAEKALREVVPDLDKYLKRRQIEIVPHDEWYLEGSTFNLKRVLNAWIDKLNYALFRGYDGIRVTGNTAWLEKRDWKNFTDYEEEINNVISKYRIITICSYSLDKCKANEIIDVVSNHQFALIRREGKWGIIESSEHKKAESDREKLLKTIETAKEAINITYADGRIMYTNDAMDELFGYKKGELIGKYASILNAGTNPEAVTKQIINTIEERGIWEGEIRNKRKEGIEFITYAKISAVKDKDGKIINFVSTQHDITEHKKMQEKLCLSEEKFARAFNASPAAVFITTLKEGRFIEINKSGVKIFGYEPDEIVGRTVMELRILGDLGDRDILVHKLQKEGAVHNIETRLRRKSGEVFDALISIDAINIAGEQCLISTAIDITERRKMEDDLKKSKEELKVIFDSVPAMIWRKDKEGKYLQVNEAYCKTVGLAKEDIIGKTDYDLYPKNIADQYYGIDQQMIKDGTPIFGIIEHYLKPDGELSWSQTDKRLFYDEEGNITGTLGFARDITKKKEVEDALRESEESFRQLADNVFEGICIHDRGKILYMNKTQAEMFGYSPSEMIGQGMFKFIAPESRDLILKNVLLGYENPYEVVGLKKDRSTFPVEIQGKFIHYQGNKVRLWTLHDITERKQAEKKLKETYEYLENLINYANTPIIVWDMNLNITRFNCAFERLTGYISEEIVGNKLSMLFPQATRDMSLEKITRTLKGEYWESMEIPILCKDGNIRLVLWNSANIHTADGKTILATIAQGVDITEREYAKEQLRVSEKKVKDLIEATTDWFWEVDKDGIYTYVSPKVKDFLGYEPNEVLGKSLFDLMTGEEKQRVGKFFREKVAKNEPFYNLENTSRHKDGHLVVLETNGIPVFDEKGQLKSYRGTNRDITERVKREDDVRQQMMKFRLEEGNVYLVEEPQPIKSASALNDLISLGYRGVAITRTPESQFKKQTLIGDAEFWWVSERGGEKSIPPDFAGVKKFIEEMPPKTAVLIERLDYLLSKNTFKETLSFVQHLRECAYLENRIIILSLDPSTLDDQERSLLKKETRSIEAKVFETLSEDLIGIMKFIYWQNAHGLKPSYTKVGMEVGASKPTTRKRIRKLIAAGFAVESLNGNTRIVELTEKGRQSLS